MDGHSKNEVLEIFNMNSKKMFLPDFFSQTGHQLANSLRFLAKWSRDIARRSLTQCLYFKMLRTMSSLSVPNFDSAPSSMPKL